MLFACVCMTARQPLQSQLQQQHLRAAGPSAAAATGGIAVAAAAAAAAAALATAQVSRRRPVRRPDQRRRQQIQQQLCSQAKAQARRAQQPGRARAARSAQLCRPRVCPARCQKTLPVRQGGAFEPDCARACACRVSNRPRAHRHKTRQAAQQHTAQAQGFLSGPVPSVHPMELSLLAAGAPRAEGSRAGG